MSDALAANPLVHAVGLSLLHFVWQGALIGGAAAWVLHATRRRAASTRYVIGCGALLLMAAAPVITTADALRAPAPINRTAATSAPSSGAPRPVAATPLMSATLGRTVGVPSSGRGVARALPAVVLLWGVGVLFMALHLAGSWLLTRTLRASASPLDETWQARLRNLSQRLGIRRAVRLVQATGVDVPTLVGWAKPMIFVPASVLAGLSPSELEAVLAHELAHVRRHDYLVNALQSVIETLLFYHPAVWWISHRVRIEREDRCDDVAVAHAVDRVAYARALAALEQQCHAPALVLAASDGDLVARIRRVLGAPAHVRRGASAWGAVFVVMSFVVALGADRVAAGNHAASNHPAPAAPADVQLAPPAVERPLVVKQAAFAQQAAMVDQVGQLARQLEQLSRDKQQSQSAAVPSTVGSAQNAYEQGRVIGSHEADFEKAVTAHDADALRGLLSDGFQMVTVFSGGATTEVGQVRTKADVLRGVTGLHAIHTDATSNGIAGGAVVVTGLQSADPNTNRYFRPERVVYTHVWVKEPDNQWRMISCVDFTGVDQTAFFDAIPLEFTASRNGGVLADSTVKFVDGASSAVPIGDGQSMMVKVWHVGPHRLSLTYTTPGMAVQNPLYARLGYPPVQFDYEQLADTASDRAAGNLAVFSIALPSHEYVEIQVRPGR